ncbi:MULTISPECIES: AAA family ATPase [unclassified Microcoleus]
MLKIDGYRILAQIYTSENSIVYRCLLEVDNQPVILKMLKQDYPTPAELIRYRQEYQIVRHLNLEGVTKAYNLHEANKTLVIVLEDFGGNSLKQWMNREAKCALSLPEFLPIAIQVTEILGKIHSHNIIHKDINPANIIFNPETRQVKIADFGIASQLTRENPTLKNPNVLEGTLAYISPEQTGRMNRSLDYRTDFYSLGVTFYELLTGQLPFETDDPLELVHCHLAKQPTLLEGDRIPQAISHIVMKLMAKTAEERYQSAYGIVADLQKCLQQLETAGQIEPFPLAEQDISDKFQIPQKLYGREASVDTLLAAFERVSVGDGEMGRRGDGETGRIILNFPNPQSKIPNPKSQIEMMLVAGYSGIGKSALVQELYKPITQARGYFIWGKFDQFQRNIPYSAIVHAFKGLMRQLLTETEEQLARWREKLLAALGVNGQVAIAVIPELELIVGQQPNVPELGPTEAQNRFNLVFGNLIRAFCSPEHPLVIFLDDLQWADSATLKLLEAIATDPDTEYLFLIGAYRDNEVSPTHPLMMLLEELRKAEITIHQIALEPLGLNHVNQLIADTLHGDLETVKPLAQLVTRKTGGNPFFVNEFLKTLYQENLLIFDRNPRQNSAIREPKWSWNLAQIEATGITDNVVELMVGKLRKLSPSAQQLLQWAACIGAEFDLNTLSLIGEQPARSVFDNLKEAIQSGLIVSLSDLNEQLVIQDYKFGHDRIQQAAYALIEEDRKQVIHLQIGRLLLQNRSPEELSEDLFTIVDHLNLGREPIAEDNEIEQLAQLNLIAGRKATSATAYAAAVQYFQTGLELLAEDCWQTQYDLALELYSRATEAAYVNGNLEQMEQWAAVVLLRARTLLDRMKVYEIQIQSCIPQNKFLEAVQAALPVLALLGIPCPESPTPADIQQGLTETISNLADRPIEDLIDLPEMSDPTQLAAMAIASSIFSASYIAAPSLLPLLVFKQVNLSLQYGNTPLSGVAYVYFGLLLCGIFGDLERGYQFGKLALAIVERFQAKKHLAKILVVFNAAIGIWKQHINESIKPFQLAYQSGLEVGDLEYAAHCTYLTALHSAFIGKNLEELAAKLAAYDDTLLKLKQTTFRNYNKIYHQTILNLLGRSKNPCRLLGEVYNESLMLPLHIEANDRYAVFCFSTTKLYLCYLFCEYEQAIENAERAEQYADGATATFIFSLFYFYDSLTRLAIYATVSREEQQKILEKVAANQTKIKIWADHAPMNYLHKYHLVEAKKHRVMGEFFAAIEHFDLAIALAQEHDFINDEALANELAAKLYLEQGKEKFAQVHLQEAAYCYHRWGAIAKVQDLETRYPNLLTQSSAKTSIIQKRTTTTTRIGLGEALDLATAIKASQAIGSEIVLEQLLRNLMKILIENAGAQTGFLLLETQGQLSIEAERSVDLEQVTVLQSINIENSEQLPLGVIQYVARTQEDVVLSDATNAGVFTREPYIVKNQPKSLLCAPIITQGKLIGILYLENNLTAGAFTPDRLEILKILSSQAAISIENARLYQNLEDKVEERTAQLAQANQEISTLNQKLKAENVRMSAELDIVKQLQQMVLPKQSELEAVEGLEIAGFMEPADEVGGDYYDVLQQDGKVKISIGDVTGHGLESGVLMIMAQTAVRTLQKMNETDPVKFLDVLNQTLYDNLQRMDSPKNMSLAILDYAGGVLKLSGQHEEAIVVRADGTLECIDTMDLGFPIGLVEEIGDFIAQQEVQLNPGDVVVLYTDGIPEAKDINKKQYGLERLWQVVVKNRHRGAEEIREAVIDDVREYIGVQKVFDDITLVVMKQK